MTPPSPSSDDVIYEQPLRYIFPSDPSPFIAFVSKTISLANSCLVDFTDVTLPDEESFSMLVDGIVGKLQNGI